MSSGISGAYASAVMVKTRLPEAFPQARLSLADTRGASLGEGLPAVRAAELRDRGVSLEETEATLPALRREIMTVFCDPLTGSHAGPGTPAPYSFGAEAEKSPSASPSPSPGPGQKRSDKSSSLFPLLSYPTPYPDTLPWHTEAAGAAPRLQCVDTPPSRQKNRKNGKTSLLF